MIVHLTNDHGVQRSITSILVCRFMLSLREFDSSNASLALSIPHASGSQLHDHAGSTFLQFSAQPSHNLPAFIASFANPVHVHSGDWSETASDSDVSGGDGDLEEVAAQCTGLEEVSRQSQAPAPNHLPPAATTE